MKEGMWKCTVSLYYQLRLEVLRATYVYISLQYNMAGSEACSVTWEAQSMALCS